MLEFKKLLKIFDVYLSILDVTTFFFPFLNQQKKNSFESFLRRLIYFMEAWRLCSWNTYLKQSGIFNNMYIFCWVSFAGLQSWRFAD